MTKNENMIASEVYTAVRNLANSLGTEEKIDEKIL